MTKRVSTIPEPLDIEVYAGDENLIEFQILADGVPVDLSGATFTAQARKSATDTASPSLEAVFADIDPTIGLFSITWDGEEVRMLIMAQSQDALAVHAEARSSETRPTVRAEARSSETWSGVWDMQILMPGKSLPKTMVRGKFNAMLDVSR